MDLDSHSPDEFDPTWARLTCRDCGDPFDGRPYVDRQCEPCRIHEVDLAAAERQRAWKLAHLVALLLPGARCAICAEAGYVTPAEGRCECGVGACDDHGHHVRDCDGFDAVRVLVCEGCL